MAAVYGLQIVGINGGQFVENIHHFQCTETGSFDAFTWAQDLVDGWYSHHKAHWLACLSADYTLVSLKARRVSAPGGPTAIKLTNDIGTHGGDTEVAGLAVEIRFPALVAGKNVTGKVYLPGIPQDQFIQNNLQAAYGALALTYAAGLLTAFNGSASAAVYTFGVYRRPKGAAPEAFTHATVATISNKPVMLKRRNVPI